MQINNFKELKISEVHSPERNVRIHPESQIREFVKSLKQFGQTRLAVIDENNEILIGNGMYEALKQAGYDTIWVYQRTDLSENEKKKMMIADYKLYGLGIDNLDTLNEFFEELHGDLDIPGYSQEILESMVATASEITEQISNYGVLDEDEVEQIKGNKERKEQNIQKSEQAQQTTSITHPIGSQNVENIATNVEKEAITEFVVCPKCGEKIWL